METVFLEIFGPFVLFGTILGLVLFFRRLRDMRRAPGAQNEDDSDGDRES